MNDWQNTLLWYGIVLLILWTAGATCAAYMYWPQIKQWLRRFLERGPSGRVSNP